MTQRYRWRRPSEPMAACSGSQRNRRTWPWPFASERLGALRASSIGCIRFDITPSHPSLGRGGGTRTPADAVLETAALPLSYTSSATPRPPNKKAASVDPGRLADLGLVVGRFTTSTSRPRRPCGHKTVRSAANTGCGPWRALGCATRSSWERASTRVPSRSQSKSAYTNGL